jgi:putative FmdB family regulatory protein
MPHYEFFCPACQKTFSTILTIAEHEEAKVVCPKCGSKNVEQQWAAFYVVTSNKSAA